MSLEKYLKYKRKYILLKKQMGGLSCRNCGASVFENSTQCKRCKYYMNKKCGNCDTLNHNSDDIAKCIRCESNLPHFFILNTYSGNCNKCTLPESNIIHNQDKVLELSVLPVKAIRRKASSIKENIAKKAKHEKWLQVFDSSLYSDINYDIHPTVCRNCIRAHNGRPYYKTLYFVHEIKEGEIIINSREEGCNEQCRGFLIYVCLWCRNNKN